MTSHQIFRKNVMARIEVSGLSPYKVSLSANRAPSWITGILNEKRHPVKVSTATIDEMAEALGVPPYELIRPGFEPRMYPLPSWLEDAKAQLEARRRGRRESAA